MSYRGEPVAGAPHGLRQLTDEERASTAADLFLLPGHTNWMEARELARHAERMRRVATILDEAASFLDQHGG